MKIKVEVSEKIEEVFLFFQESDRKGNRVYEKEIISNFKNAGSVSRVL